MIKDQSALLGMLDMDRFRQSFSSYMRTRAYDDNGPVDESAKKAYEESVGPGSFNELRRSPVPDEQTAQNLAVNTILPLFQKQFKKKIGRDATDQELAKMFNEMDYDNAFTQATRWRDEGKWKLGEDVFAPDTLGKIVEGASSLTPYLEGNKQLYTEITKANNQLKQINQSLSPDQVADVLSSQDRASASEIANSHVQAFFDKAATDEAAQVQPKQEQAIAELSQALTGQAQQTLSNDYAPMIAQELNKRGIISGGDLASALTSTAGTLARGVQGITAPLLADAKMGGATRNYETVLRGQLAAGKSLDDAINFSRNFYNQGVQNTFASGQADLNRQFQDEMTRQQMAMQLAMQPKQKSPSSLDYFLQYGLPALTQLGQGAIKAAAV